MLGLFACAQNDSRRDQKGVIEREKAAIGALITLREPSKPMLTEAAAAGFYESKDFPGRYPRVFVTLSPSLVILSETKDLCISLRVNSAKGRCISFAQCGDSSLRSE